MELDLFTLVERFFSGVIQFLFNVVESVVILVRRPRAGPRFLWRRFRNPESRQVGPNTLLLLLLMPTQMLAITTVNLGIFGDAPAYAPAADGGNEFLTKLTNALHDLIATGEVSDFLVRPVPGALAVAVLVDVFLRLRMLRQHRRSQSDRVPVTKYRIAVVSLMSALLLVIVLVYIVLLLVLAVLVLFMNEWAALGLTLLGIFLPLFLYFKVFRRYRWTRRVPLGLTFVIFSFLVGLGAVHGYDRLKSPDPFAYAHGHEDAATVLAFECRLDDPTDPRIDLVLHNAARQTASFFLAPQAKVRFLGNKTDTTIALRSGDTDRPAPRFLALDGFDAAVLTFRPRDEAARKTLSDAIAAARQQASTPSISSCSVEARRRGDAGWRVAYPPR